MTEVTFFRLMGRKTVFRLTRRWSMADGHIQVVTGRTIHETAETTARVVDVEFMPREEAYESALEYKHRLESDEAAASRLLKSVPGVGSLVSKGIAGLTPDHVKASPMYRAAKKEYAAAFNALREYNGAFVKIFKHEYQAERREKESGQ